jgi:hypothetical protein
MWLRKDSMVKFKQPDAAQLQGGGRPVPRDRPVLGVVEWSLPYKYGYLNTQVGMGRSTVCMWLSMTGV